MFPYHGSKVGMSRCVEEDVPFCPGLEDLAAIILYTLGNRGNCHGSGLGLGRSSEPHCLAGNPPCVHTELFQAHVTCVHVSFARQFLTVYRSRISSESRSPQPCGEPYPTKRFAFCLASAYFSLSDFVSSRPLNFTKTW